MVRKKKIKIEKNKTEEQLQIERFIKILLLVLIFVGAIYAFTAIFITKESSTAKKEVTKGTIDYNKLIVGNILNQKYDEYYVFAYDGNGKNAIYYSSIIDAYMSKEDAKKVYWIDLSNKLNEKYIANEDEEINKKPQNLLELKFGEYALIKIKNNKIAKYIDNAEAAKTELNK